MSLFSQQIMERRRLDNEEVEDSYARLAASVAGTGRTPTFSLDDAAAAFCSAIIISEAVSRNTISLSSINTENPMSSLLHE